MILAFRSLSVRRIAIGVSALSAFLLFLATNANAQTSRVGATLEGIVRDTSGAIIPNSNVTRHNPSTNQSRTVATDGQVFFRAEELPVRSRNYLDFVLLAPGVSSSPVASGQSGSTPLTGSGFTFAGLRSRSNNVSIDGLDNNDEYTGSSRV